MRPVYDVDKSSLVFEFYSVNTPEHFLDDDVAYPRKSTGQRFNIIVFFFCVSFFNANSRTDGI